MARQAKTEMRIRSRQKDGSNGLIKETRLGGILSPVWYSVAMISSLLGLLLKRCSLSVSPVAGARPFAQVLSAIVLLVIATVAASTVAWRPPRPFVPKAGAAIEAGESPLRNWLPRCGAREVGAPYFLLPVRRRYTAGRAVRACASGRASRRRERRVSPWPRLRSGLRHRGARATP